MGTKLNPGAFDCYHNALPDEPMFILLARDPSAPALVRQWAAVRDEAILSGERPWSDVPMILEARQCADQMVAWRAARTGEWRNARPPGTLALGVKKAITRLKEWATGERAYKQGWADREADILERAASVLPTIKATPELVEAMLTAWYGPGWSEFPTISPYPGSGRLEHARFVAKAREDMHRALDEALPVLAEAAP